MAMCPFSEVPHLDPISGFWLGGVCPWTLEIVIKCQYFSGERISGFHQMLKTMSLGNSYIEQIQIF